MGVWACNAAQLTGDSSNRFMPPDSFGPLYRGERDEARWHPRSPIRSTAEDTAAGAFHSRAGTSIKSEFAKQHRPCVSSAA